MAEEMKKYVYQLVKQIDGLYGVVISDRDGVPILKVCDEAFPPYAQQPNFLSMFGIATEQASKLGLSKNKSLIAVYTNYQLVLLNKQPLIVTMIAASTANTGLILDLEGKLDDVVNELKSAILCIHGYRQNGQTFREKTGAFRKLIKKQAELVFITAPHKVPPLPDSDDDDKDERGWWFSRDDDYFRAQDASSCSKGYQESITLVEEQLRELGPLDGILAFSQGAALLGLICALKESGSFTSSFDFAILVAGFRSRSHQHQVLYEHRVTLPTLHVYGDTDGVIHKQMSEDLVKLYDNATILSHPGGHFLPATSAQRPVYTDFLNKMLERKKLRS